MSWMSSLWANGDAVKNLSDNVSIILNGINSANPIPITISQATDPWQFWVSTGVALVTGAGILAVPILLSGGNPLKKAKSMKEFSRITGRPTIVIDHGKQSLFKPAMIDANTVRDVEKAFLRFNGRDCNMYLLTGGGGVHPSQLLSDIMMKYPGRIHVYVSRFSMSGGTLLALSATDLHMTEYASLGPVDPQVGSILSSGSAKGWETVVAMKKEKSNDNSILHSLTGKQVTKTLRENIIKAIKNKTNRAEEFTDFITNGNLEHIYQIKMDKLREFGFNNIHPITNMENKLLSEMVN